ncbi:MAG: hypothetical protein MUO72_09505 [Bacteroidales bacterium]|nr:hypothetical protein [Bacteroidales bacterium]
MIPDLKPELKAMINNIAQKNMFYGNKVPASVMALFEVVETDFNVGVLVPYWLGVLQRGRGPRRSSQSSGLVNKIYAWMQSRNMFRSGTAKGKLNEARFITLYINKYGNVHFRSKRFIDIYEAERKKAIESIEKKFTFEINKITMEVL